MNFLGTDTIAGVMMARKFYGCPMAGFSIPAAEHRYAVDHSSQPNSLVHLDDNFDSI